MSTDHNTGRLAGYAPATRAGALTRRADGRAETARDRRFFDLRQSGYRDPIDQDGRAVMSRTDSSGSPLELLKGGGTGTGTPDDKHGQLAARRREP